MNTPLVSVIVPIYGIQNYMGECIGSMMEQTRRKASPGCSSMPSSSPPWTDTQPSCHTFIKETER